MSATRVRWAAALITLLIAGGAMACPDASKDKSADAGKRLSAPTTQSPTGGTRS